MTKAFCALPVLAAIMVTPSLAQASGSASNQPAAEKPTAGSPNEVVCQKLEVTGTRLAQKRVCKTRAQWADQKLQDRMEVEKVQVQRGMKAE
jgi:invasion protein IalB